MTTILGLLFCGWVAVSGPARAADPFVGRWTLNASRSQIVDQMRVETVGANKYRFVFAGTASETIVADGTDQPGLSGTTLSVTVEGPRDWKVVRKQEARTLLAARWKLSEDGRTLRDSFTLFQTNGSASTVDYVYERTAGTSGFPGTWESTSQQLNDVYELQIQPFAGDGLSFATAVAGVTRNVKFDGSDSPNVGAGQGSTSAGRRVNDRALELTTKVDGKAIDTRELRLSDDGRILTITIHQEGRSKPTVLVFDRT